MNQEISFLGYSTVPSDHESTDGELAAAINIIPEDGAMRPISTPKLKFALGSGYRLFIHKSGIVTNYLAYIPENGTSIRWIGSEPGGKFTVDKQQEISMPNKLGKIISIAAVGYMIMVSTETDLYYIRFNANKRHYIFLGSKLPEIDLDFALKLNFAISDTQAKDFEVIVGNESGDTTTIDEDWLILYATSFNASYANGMLRREFCDPGSNPHLISTQHIPFDSAVVLKKDVEYRFKFDNFLHQNGLAIQIWGYRNGSTVREVITGGGYEGATAGTYEWTKTITDEWHDISLRVAFLWNQDPNHSNCATRGNLTIYKGIDNTDTGSHEVSHYIEYTSDSHNAIMGAVNKFVNEQITEKCRFIYPFFVRYAIQLFDGSYARLSEPILMVPNSGYAPAVQYSKHYKLGTRLIMTAFAADLRYKLQKSISEDWQDIISGIDIFVSLPIWAYDQGQNYDGSKNYLQFHTNIESYGFGRVYIDNVPCEPSQNEYSLRSLADYIERYATNILQHNYVEIAPRSKGDILDDVKSCSNFYKIASLSIEEINNNTSEFADIELEKGVIPTLATREALKDDILPYVGFKNACLKEFNSRLHICHSAVILPPPSSTAKCFNHLTPPADYDTLWVDVVLATEDGRKLTQRSHDVDLLSGPWFFYPDSRATSATFTFIKDAKVKAQATVSLKRHNMLNGVYWLSPDGFLGSLPITPCFSYSIPDPDNTISALSAIYVSEANCPFIFKASSVVSVGAQEVFALSNAAKALSQGQFGEFPLYAFSSEGIWALSTNAIGTYSAVQPIVRDETLNIDSITQIDSAVLFASQRGIMLLSGSQTQCISDQIFNDHPFNVMDLPKMNMLHEMLHSDNCIPTAPFSDFILSCQMLYDYPHQRIIIYNPNHHYAYVYSLKSKAWGMMQARWRHNVNSYPEAYVIDQDDNLLDFSSKTTSPQDNQPPIPALLVTRPLKLDLPHILKTIDTVIQRGNFQKGHVQSVLYGSRDLTNWHLIWSSRDHYLRGFRGTPYKYFRIALLCHLQPQESIQGATIQFNPRQTNQPR